MQPYLSFGYGVPLAELTPAQRDHTLSDSFYEHNKKYRHEVLEVEGFCEGAFHEWPEANALMFRPPLNRYRESLGGTLPMLEGDKGIDVSVLADLPDLLPEEKSQLKQHLEEAGSTVDPESFRWIVFTSEY